MPDAERFHWLLHLDLDQFQVAVERRRRPDLVGKQVIVGGDGDPSKARQVVTCGSYETRDRGVRAGMPLRAAVKKAPDAVFLPLDMELYTEASGQVWDVVRSLGHPVEVWGLDEGYIGFGPRESDPPPLQDAEALGEQLRVVVGEQTGLDCCVGISDNKQRAKIAAGFAKKAVRDQRALAVDAPSPDADSRSLSGASCSLSLSKGPPLKPNDPVCSLSLSKGRQFTLTDANWTTLMGDRPVDALWSVGGRTAKKLGEQQISTVSELATTPLDALIALFGPHKGNWLFVLSRGGGDDSITSVEPPAKSHSKSRTYPEDLTEREQVHAAAHELLRELLAQVVGERRMPVRVGMTVRTSTFYTRTKLRKLPAPTAEYDAIAPTVDALLDLLLNEVADGPESSVQFRPIRLLAVRLELVP